MQFTVGLKLYVWPGESRAAEEFNIHQLACQLMTRF